MNFTKRVALIALVVVTCCVVEVGASPPRVRSQLTQIFPPSGGTTYSAASPLPATYGGIGPYVLPTTGAGNTDYFDGDSITNGYLATSCSLTSSSPSGTCFSDLVSIYDGAAEVNLAVTGTCLLYTTTSGSYCNQVSATNGSLQQRYANDFASLTAGMRFHLMIGTNDLNAYSLVAGDPQVTPSAYRAALVTVTAAAATIVCPLRNATCLQQNMILEEIPFARHLFQPMWQQFNAIIADVAASNGYSLASTGNTIQLCALQNYATDPTCLQTDFLHPTTNGHAAIAVAVEGANYGTAVSERTAQASSMASQFYQNQASFLTQNYCAGFYACQTLTGIGTTAIGENVGAALTTANSNTLGGAGAGKNLTTGASNSVWGNNCLSATGSGTAASNIGMGINCLQTVTTGSNDIGIGNASFTGANCSLITKAIFIGSSTSCLAASETDNIVIGYSAPDCGSHCTQLGTSTTTTTKTYGGYCPGNLTAEGTACYYSGTGAPTFSAPSGSMYIRYDGSTGSRWYANTSTASTSGTTWTAQASP